MNFRPLILALLALAACTGTVHKGQMIERLPAAEGSLVPLGKAVELGRVIIEPIRVIEDSRCPINARCVWAGRLVIEAAVIERADDGWSEFVQLTLGESYSTHDASFMLAFAEPDTIAGEQIDASDYRFRFTQGHQQ